MCAPSVEIGMDIFVRAVPAEGELPTYNDPRWANAPAIDFPLVGQIIQEPRQFTPSINAVTVRAMHTAGEIALLLLSWDDRTHSKANPETHLRRCLRGAMAGAFDGGAGKALFLYGDTSRPVYLWRWTANAEGISELNATGFRDGVAATARKPASQGNCGL